MIVQREAVDAIRLIVVPHAQPRCVLLRAEALFAITDALRFFARCLSPCDEVCRRLAPFRRRRRRGRLPISCVNPMLGAELGINIAARLCGFVDHRSGLRNTPSVSVIGGGRQKLRTLLLVRAGERH
jgi:hypothetical protein